jgi:hypothetical protein
MWNKNEKEIEASSLVGEVLTHVDDCDDEILLTTESGRRIIIKHEQDCCESVHIEGIEGEWHTLIGKVIVEAKNEIASNDCGECGESCTHTELTFKVDDATVISRWIGSSNGYYSEAVELYELIDKNKAV